MNEPTHNAKYCVIGAGPAGLAALKNFAARGIEVEGFEREPDVGGNWNYGRRSSGVYASTHLISSKRLTEYTDFPMPKEFPPFPSHRQALAYLQAYADHFQLRERIRFNTEVQRVEADGNGWRVTLSNGESQLYAGVIVANGHHWKPREHTFPGEFSGQIIHSHDYKRPEILADRRVLVVGAGNSGCDIAVEAAQHAEATFLSMRRGYHFLPKFLHGRPVDLAAEKMRQWHVPLWFQRWTAGMMVRIALGRPERYGLPPPDHKLFETHPIVNSQLLYYVGHGLIGVRPNVERLEGESVRFADGRVEKIDLIVLAIGYEIRFPFLDESLVLDERGRPKLYLNAFHPEYDNFFVAGLIQPNSGLWGLVDYQTQLMAALVAAQRRDPAAVEWFRKLKRSQVDLGHGIHFVDSPRHVLEIEYFSYRERLKKLVRRAEGNVRQKPRV